MQVYYELDLYNFKAWSGGKDTLDVLTCEQANQLENELSDVYPDGLEETALNDVLWFERDWIAELLGFTSWEHLEAVNNGEDWEEEDAKDVMDADGFWTEYTWYKNDADKHIFIFGDRGLYTPYNSDYDHECDSYDEAKEWFENYKGFEEDEDNE